MQNIVTWKNFFLPKKGSDIFFFRKKSKNFRPKKKIFQNHIEKKKYKRFFLSHIWVGKPFLVIISIFSLNKKGEGSIFPGVKNGLQNFFGVQFLANPKIFKNSYLGKYCKVILMTLQIFRGPYRLTMTGKSFDKKNLKGSKIWKNFFFDQKNRKFWKKKKFFEKYFGFFLVKKSKFFDFERGKICLNMFDNFSLDKKGEGSILLTFKNRPQGRQNFRSTLVKKLEIFGSKFLGYSKVFFIFFGFYTPLGTNLSIRRK